MLKIVDSIIHAKHILRGRFPFSLLDNHALVIHQGKILDILPSETIDSQYQTNQLVKLGHHVLLPGLINGHTHIGMNLLRGYADDIELYTWLTKHIWPCEKQYANEAFVRDATELACAEMIRSGTTCFNDMYFFPEVTADILEDIGMRAFLGASVIDAPTHYATSVPEYFKKGLTFIERYEKHPRIRPTLSPHSTYSLSEKHLAQVQELALDKNLKINIHLQESPKDIEACLKKNGKRPLRLLHQLGMTSAQLIGIHFACYDQTDVDILSETNSHLIHCPESNLKLASGWFHIREMKQKNIRVGLGTDSVASNNDLNLWGEMRMAALLAKMLSHDPTALPAAETFSLCTSALADILGVGNELGALEKNHAADCIALDVDQIELLPCFDLLSHLIYATDRSQVTHTWVAGRCLMENRDCLTLDVERIRHQAKKWQKKLKS